MLIAASAPPLVAMESVQFLEEMKIHGGGAPIGAEYDLRTSAATRALAGAVDAEVAVRRDVELEGEQPPQRRP